MPTKPECAMRRQTAKLPPRRTCQVGFAQLPLLVLFVHDRHPSIPGFEALSVSFVDTIRTARVSDYDEILIAQAIVVDGMLVEKSCRDRQLFVRKLVESQGQNLILFLQP